MKSVGNIIDERMRERIARRAAEMFAEDPDCPRWAYSFDDHVDGEDLLNHDGGPSEALIDFARERVDEALGLLTSRFSNGPASVWRAVTGDDDLVEEIARSGEIGIYWTWVPEAAFAHWGGSGDVDVIFRAEVNADHINWPETILANALDAGADEGFHEAEVRLKPTSVLRILDACSREREDIFYDCSYNDLTSVDIGPLAGIDLKAGRAADRTDALVLENVDDPPPVAVAFG